LLVGEAWSILQDSVKCLLHVRSEVKLDTCVNSALFHFTKGLVLTDITQFRTIRFSTCGFISTGVRSVMCTVKL
jgi:hypothetical protein